LELGTWNLTWNLELGTWNLSWNLELELVFPVLVSTDLGQVRHVMKNERAIRKSERAKER